MKAPRKKGFWTHRAERFHDGGSARARAKALRMFGPDKIAHVVVSREGDDYVVRFSIAGWYLNELADAEVVL